MIRIIIIGTGNIGGHLCNAFEIEPASKKVQLTGYYNRTQKQRLDSNASLIKDLSQLPEADLILLAVPDDAIEKVSQQIKVSNAIVAHTSGSVAMSVLYHHPNHGVFYLPQSFSSFRKPRFEDVHICLESSSKEVNEVLELVGGTLSRKREQINSTQRKKLHLAAVYMNNFVNHCYSKAEELMEEASIDVHLLDALMRETLEKAISLSPKMSQTGPAIRNDLNTIKKHLELLEKGDREMYRSITKSIQKTHGKKL